MWILPYFESTPAPAPVPRFPVRSIWVFLEKGGAQVWWVDDAAPATAVYEEHCVPNGLIGTPFYSAPHNTLVVRIDPARTNMKDFYFSTEFQLQSKEIPSDTDLWRPFFWLGTSDPQDPFAWKRIAARHPLGSFGSIQTLWERIFESESAAASATT
jgi:hypothetical protein